jgi:catechol 2,3-dioxygenase-like lactoylglutathione lyase family enzyme
VEDIISSLLKRYERGMLSRRELVRGLALLSAAGATAPAAGFQGSHISHVSVQVSDLARSRDFYSRSLGLSVLAEGGPENTVRLGQNGRAFVILRNGSPAGTVDHFAIGVEGFNKDSVIQDLKQRGTMPIDGGNIGPGFHVKDPDGFNIQIERASLP